MTMISRQRLFSLITCCASLFTLAESGRTQAPPFEWVRTGGGASDDHGYGIAVNATGEAFVAGDFFGSATFGSFGVSNVAGGVSDPGTFLAKYDRTGGVV